MADDEPVTNHPVPPRWQGTNREIEICSQQHGRRIDQWWTASEQEGD